jgi:anti-sigma regulatory factor (Ser/Thr protein kinase)
MSKGRAGRRPGRSREKFVCSIPAQTSYMAAVREMVAAAAREHGFPDHDVAQAVMAVDEACVNVVEHAYRDDPPGTNRAIEISVDAGPERLVVTINDEAPRGFSPLKHPQPDITTCWTNEERPGLGILILRKFMDDVRHRFRPGVGNELKLVKYPSKQTAGTE